MSDEQIQATNAPAPQQPPSASQLDSTAAIAEWMNKAQTAERQVASYKGHFDKASNDLAQAKAALQQLTDQHTLAVNELEKLRKITARVPELETKSATAQRQLDTARLIIKDYPDLASAWAKGLLVTDNLEGNTLSEYLDGWREELGSREKSARRDTVTGKTPERPTPAQPTSHREPGEIWSEMARLRPGTPEYQRLYNEYIAAVSAN